MLTPVERVLILKCADLLKNVGPRHLRGLAAVAREVEISKGDTIFQEEDPSDAVYMVVEGRVRLSTPAGAVSEVGPGEAFGTWALVDDAARGRRAECTEDGVVLALHRDEFYDVAAGDLTLLQEVVRSLARRMRALVSDRPGEARVELEGVEKPEALPQPETEESASPAPPDAGPPAAGGASLAAAALGDPPPKSGEALPPKPPVPDADRESR